MNEAAGTVTMTVGKEGPEAGTVQYATAPGTARSSFPSDFTTTSGTLNFAAGEAAKTFTVSIVGDDYNDEDTETFTVNLSSPSSGNVLGSPSQATVAIQDDDPTPTFSLRDGRAAEDGGTLYLQIELSARTGRTVTGTYTITPGTATAGSDYPNTSGSFTVPAGSLSYSLPFAITPDELSEGNETLSVQLTDVVGATPVDALAEGTILDDDGIVDLSLDKSAPNPWGAGQISRFDFQVSNLTSVAARSVTIRDQLPAGTVWAGWGYSPSSAEPENIWNCSSDASGRVITCTRSFLAANSTSRLSINLSFTGNGPFTNNATVSTTSIEPNTFNNSDQATATVEPPGTLAFSAVGSSVVEGNGGYNTAQVTVTRSGGNGGYVSATCSATGGTATVGQDYLAYSEQLYFNPGQTSATCYVPLVADSVQEPDETIELRLTSPTGGASLGTPSSFTLTVQDDDQPRLTVNDVSKSEGNSGGSAFTFTATLTKAPAQAVSCSYTTSDGTANAGSDYATASGTLTIPVGQTSATVGVTVHGDADLEANETFLLTLSSCSGVNATGNDFQGQGTIQNDDASSFSFSSFIYSGEEGTAVTLTVNRVGSTPAATVPYQTTNDAAGSGYDDAESSDYAGTSTGSVSFAAGETSKSFTVQTTEDSTDEQDETFGVILGVASQGQRVYPYEAIVIIQDVDGPPALAVSDVSKAEGNTGQTDFVLTVSLSAPSEKSVTGFSGIVGCGGGQNCGTASSGSDYEVSSSSFAIAAGETSTTLAVKVNGDTVSEPDETFFVQASANNTSNFNAVGQVTIDNDDFYDLEVIKNAPAGAAAPHQYLHYSIAVTNLPTSVVATQTTLIDVLPAAVTFVSAEGGFAQGTSCNYNGTTRTVTCNLGNLAPSQNKNVTITVRPNQTGSLSNTATASADGEDGDPSNNSSTVVREVAEPGAFRFSSATYSVGEGDGTKTITVERVGGTAGRATVDYYFYEGTATQGADFTWGGGRLVFQAGEVQRSFTVTVLEDSVDEADETVQLELDNPTPFGATLGTPDESVLTIEDNDGAPTLSIDDVSAVEGDSGPSAFTFTATLSTASGREVTGNYSTDDGTATDGFDYEGRVGSFSILAGSTSATFTVRVNGDLLPEPNESFLLKLSGISGITASGNDLTGQGTIQNDDLADIKLTKSLVAGTPNPAPTGASLTFLLRLQNLSASPGANVNVVDTLPAGTSFVSASDGCNYDSTTHSVTCGYGTVAGNANAEDRTIVVVPTTAGLKLNAALATSTSPDSDTTNNASQAAVDVQAPGSFRFSSSAYSVEEGSSRVVTVERTGGAGGAAAVDYTTTPGSAEPDDFTDNAATLAFAPGETAKTFTVVTLEDAVDEIDETVGLSLANPTGGATLGAPANAALTIEDDDATPALSVADGSKDEGHSGASPVTFAMRLTGISDRPVTVSYATEDGTAKAPGDYTSASGSLTFAPGESEKTVAVQIIGDRALEPDETLVLRLSGAANATIGDGEATGTIRNDDGAGADLTLTKTGPAEAPILSEFDYTLRVTNKGPDTASSVGLQDVLPLEVRFVSARETQGSCSGTEAVSCALGTLAAGQSAEVTIRVRAVVTGTARNSATAAAVQHDPTPADNAATATTAIRTQPGVPREPSMALPCKITVTTDYIFRGLVTFVGVSVTRDGVPLDGIKVYSKHSWHPKITNTKTNRFGYTEYHFLTRTPGGTVEFVADCDRNGLRPASVRNLRTYGAGRSAHAQEPADISYTTGLKETTQLSRVTPFVGSGQRMPLRSDAAKANCQSVRVSSSSLRARRTGSVTVQVLFAGRPVKTAAVVLDGAVGRQIKATGLSGRVVFRVRPAKSGSIRVRVPNFATCSSVATLAVAS